MSAETALSAEQKLITENIDLWTSAIKAKATQGRGSSSKRELYGIKKLRELILELAVRGKLVPQDPSDEPASVLLERIAAEKMQLVKDKKIKKQKPLPEIEEQDIPYSLPLGWKWVRLGDLCVLENGDRSKNYPNKSVLVDTGVPFVNAGQLNSGRISRSDMTFITEERYELLRAGKFKNGDILYCLRGSLGKSALVDGFEQGAIASSLVIVRTYPEVERHFLLKYFDAPLSEQMIRLYDNGTAQPNLSAADLAKFLVPLPTRNEQSRIVVKVDELMALCDQLEQKTEASLDAHQLLVDTLLATLTNAQDADELSESWARLSEHFDTLITTDYAVEQLKQTILQLAVMGKLVPQNPNDEPASELLKRIAAEKAQLIKDKKIKKQKPLPEITDEEKPFALPEGWEWIRFGECIDLISGQHLKPDEYSEVRLEDGFPYITGPAEFGDIYPTYSKFTLENRALAKKGDILITCKGSGIGKSNTAIETIAISRQLMAARPIIINSRYAILVVDANYDYFQRKGVGIAIPGISRNDVTDLLIALPPQSEQQQIIIKFDQIMTLCDQLKDRLSEAQATQLTLADTVVSGTLN